MNHKMKVVADRLMHYLINVPGRQNSINSTNRRFLSLVKTFYNPIITTRSNKPMDCAKLIKEYKEYPISMWISQNHLRNTTVW